MYRFTWVLMLLFVVTAISQAGCQTQWSPRKTFRLETQMSADGYEYNVWVRSGKKRKLLPPQTVIEDYPEDYKNPDAAKKSNQFDMDMVISPDDRWIFALLKVERRFTIGYLFKRVGPVDFQPATKKQFDMLAWLYARTLGVKSDLSPEEPYPFPRIIQFESWSKNSRYLNFSLKPVKRPRSSSFLWKGRFDTHRMRFVKSPQ